MRRFIRFIRLTWYWWCWQNIKESIATIKFLLPRDTEIDPWCGYGEINDIEVEMFGRMGAQDWTERRLEEEVC
jgi:hypothetical protein